MTRTHGPGTYADDAQRYRLEARIATGGMGEVWRATDTTLGRQVAVKLLKDEYADDATFRSRFVTEARHAASLHHPGVAGVYDFGEAASTDGSGVPRPFLVMELVDGQPLSALLHEGEQLDPDAVRGLLVQVAEAIGAAHAAGIVHRDLKPANLLVTPQRTVKVTDFGIARAAEGVGMTQTGQVMGTPQYLSPEQARGNPATPASDVYSIGVVAFEMLAGRRPFQADSPVATALAHLNDPVPDLPADVPADLAAVVRRALAKDPSERYADAAALAAALRDPSTELVAAPPPAPVPSTEATQVIGATAVAPAAAAALDPPTTVAPVTPAAGVPATGAATGAAPTTADGRGRRGLVAALLAALLVLGGVLAALALTRGDSTDDPVTTPSSADDGTVTVEEEDYVGRPVARVRRALRDAGLLVTTREVANPGEGTPGDVTSVDPSGRLRVGDEVTVEYWGDVPVVEPTEQPTEQPTEAPTSEAPTEQPSTQGPTEQPSQAPTSEAPAPDPTSSASPQPSSPAATTAPAADPSPTAAASTSSTSRSLS